MLYIIWSSRIGSRIKTLDVVPTQCIPVINWFWYLPWARTFSRQRLVNDSDQSQKGNWETEWCQDLVENIDIPNPTGLPTITDWISRRRKTRCSVTSPDCFLTRRLIKHYVVPPDRSWKRQPGCTGNRWIIIDYVRQDNQLPRGARSISQFWVQTIEMTGNGFLHSRSLPFPFHRHRLSTCLLRCKQCQSFAG